MNTTDEPLIILRKLGLSPTACRCYLYLAAQLPRGLRSARIAEGLSVKPSSLFRALNELTEKGFVQQIRIIHAASYRAEPLTHALDNYAQYQRHLATPLLRQQRNNDVQNN